MNINESLQAERGQGQRGERRERGRNTETMTGTSKVKEEKLRREQFALTRENKNHTESCPLPLSGFPGHLTMDHNQCLYKNSPPIGIHLLGESDI